METITRLLAAWAVIGLVAGCASSKPPPPPQVSGVVAASEALNPDVNGRPSPAVVRVYQLRSSGPFGSADFFSLYREADATLGPDLVASEELLVQPGDNREYSAEIDPQTRYLGVVVAFRDIANAQWRSGVSLPEEKLERFLSKNQLRIQLEELAVRVSTEPR